MRDTHAASKFSSIIAKRRGEAGASALGESRGKDNSREEQSPSSAASSIQRYKIRGLIGAMDFIAILRDRVSTRRPYNGYSRTRYGAIR